MKRTIALILSALIISLSACSMAEDTPTIGSDAQLSSLPESSSLPEVITEPEPVVEPEPVLEPVVYLSAKEVQRGSYITMRVENIDLSDYSFTDFLGYERKFLAKDGGWYCHIPVKTAAEAGEYTLEFTCEDYTFSEKITVTERKFPTQYLTVAPSTLEQALENEAVRAAFDEFYQKYRWVNSGVALWDGEFVLPLGDAYYKETTAFGTFRTFSNGNTEWHNATDMAAPGGTPVYATNSGVILFADYLGLTGNTIIINHGYGILSWHYHMSKLEAEKGDMVKKGDLIGKVGTTGLSTGNHLHFGISVGGIFVDPMAMIGTEPDLDFWKESAEQ